MFDLDFPSEKFIEDYVEHCIAHTETCPIDGEQVSYVLRQHEIKAYGRTDIIKLRVSPGALDIYILELKNEPLNELHLAQLARYMAGAKRQAERYQNRFPDYLIEVHGQLAGPFVPGANDFVWMLEQTESIDAFALSISISEGFVSEEISRGWFKKNQDSQGGRKIAKIVAPEIFRLEAAIEEMERKERIAAKESQ